MNAKKLRDSILQSAIQGKLVPQNPKDIPASKLLIRFTEEKQRMIKEGIIKKEKPLPPIKKEEIPFDIPSTWEWVRLGNLVSIFGRIGYRGYTKEDMVKKGEGSITISPSNITSGGETNFDNCSYISWHKYEESPEIMIYNGDIILVKTGSSYGKCAIVRDLPEKATINPQLVVFKNILCNADYLDLVLKSNLATNQYEQFVIGTSIPTFSQSKLSSLLLPLPPIEEQYRIVQKIEELMLNVYQYNQAYLELEKLNKKFPKDMEKSILQYAMQGKLVEQDSNDEPAQQLLQKIQIEKERLIKEKVIKKEKPLPPISEEEIPFDIPSTWEWVRIKDIYYNSGQKKPDSEFCYIDVSCIDNKEGIITEEYKILKADNAPSRARKIVHIGEVIYSTVRPYLQNIAIIDRDFENETIASTAFVVMRPIKCYNKYLFYVLKSPYFDSLVESKMQGATYPAINDTNFNNLIVPIPPIEEQYRIVEAIEKLLGTIAKIKSIKE